MKADVITARQVAIGRAFTRPADDPRPRPVVIERQAELAIRLKLGFSSRSQIAAWIVGRALQ